MAVQNNEATRMPASISTILQNLSNRPNVHSTLIISRSDGSIINATGRESQNTISRGNTVPSYPNSEFEDQSHIPVPSSSLVEEADSNIPEPNTKNREPTSTEKLAASIVDFVNSATLLASSLRMPTEESDTMKQQGGGEGQIPQQGTQDNDNTTTNRDQEIQLLRLRLRRQEVIIFPDAHYLCCVVQNVGR